MAKERIINTKFWSDGYVLSLNPLEKVLFLYLLTNDKTNISGIYEIATEYISIETGIKKEEIVRIFRKLSRDKKVIYLGGWVAIINFLKHQHTESETVIKGIVRELKDAPKEIVYSAQNIGYGEGIDRVWVQYNILNLTKLNLTEHEKTNEPQVVLEESSTTPAVAGRGGFVPVDWNSPLNKKIKYYRKHRIIYATDGNKYGIPPNGGKYIPYEQLLKS